MSSSRNIKRKKRQQKAKIKRNRSRVQEAKEFPMEDWINYKIGILSKRVFEIRNDRKYDIFLFVSLFISSILIAFLYFKVSNFEFSLKVFYFMILSIVGLSATFLLWKTKLPTVKRTIGFEFTEVLIRKAEIKITFLKEIHLGITLSLIGFGILFNGGIFSQESGLNTSDIMIWFPIITILSFIILYLPIRFYKQDMEIINL